MMIAKNRLSDGSVIKFAIEHKETYPDAKSAIVSGCVTEKDIEELEANELLYSSQSFIYGSGVWSVRKCHSIKASVAEFLTAKSDADRDDRKEKKRFWALFRKNVDGGSNSGD
ncbi:MAG: hypothetical protein ACON4O_02715 [Lentimonas sp.]